jgi:transposase InsO family protein
MLHLLKLVSGVLVRSFRARGDLLLENLALRQQLAVLSRCRPRPRFSNGERFLWIMLRRVWSGWRKSLIVVQPDTVVRWHRAGFKLYWKWISRPRVRVGRRPTSKEMRELICRMVAENSTWGAPRIHGELQMLGFDISERTVLRWMPKAPQDPEPATRWAAFLGNHREVIAAMDFFTVPTLSFGVLYCFFVIAHDRRRILHLNATQHPTSAWVSQQLREAFPYDCAPTYLIFDRASNFAGEVIDAITIFGIQPKRTSFRSPWQNGIAERFVGTYRRELLDHVIVLNEQHLKRLMNDFVRYYHGDRTHLGLAKETPGKRRAEKSTGASSGVVSLSRVGGLHHRCHLAA